MHSTRAHRLHIVALSLCLLFANACNDWLPAAFDALGSTTKTLTVGVHGFEEFDRDYQLALVRAGKAAGKSPDEIDAELRDYRVHRLVVQKAIADLGAVVLTGKGLLVLAAKGQADKGDVAAWVGDLFKASNALSKALQQIGAAHVVEEMTRAGKPQGGLSWITSRNG